MGGFFPGMLGDLLRLLKSDAPFPFELAQQLAESIATEDDPKPVDPLNGIRLEELLRIADLQVAAVTGMTTSVGGKPVSIIPLSRVDWARTNLFNWRSTLELLAVELRPGPNGPAPPVSPEDDDGAASQLGALLGQWAEAIAPAMIAMQFGSLIGHLARRTLEQHELILVRSDDDALTVVPENVSQFASDWSLARDEAAFYLPVHDVALQAIVSRPHVR